MSKEEKEGGGSVTQRYTHPYRIQIWINFQNSDYYAKKKKFGLKMQKGGKI